MVSFPCEQLNPTFLVVPSDAACFHITHVLCSTHFVSDDDGIQTKIRHADPTNQI
ncbi:hypothetical protein BDR04DRAFT_1107189 [Suillus decipiens]|nr:hypothetical protein BDR04DRAFT_1107189 [Suillus decipiens]